MSSVHRTRKRQKREAVTVDSSFTSQDTAAMQADNAAPEARSRGDTASQTTKPKNSILG